MWMTKTQKNAVNFFSGLGINLSRTENNVFGIICDNVSEDTKKRTPGKQHNQPRLLNDQNTKKFIIKLMCTNPRIVSAEKDVVETFTLQLLNTLLP